MKNTVNKRLLTTIMVGILLISQLIVPITSYGLSFGGMKGDADNFINKGTNGQKITLQEAITKLVPIGNVLVLIATIVLVVVGMIMGLKYMIGGTDQKANMKEKLIWYIISIALVYGAVGIFTIVVNIMNNILS
ncbi:unknown [Clostridium sp. CAG:793]|nr:unknown [Clostridium sp. CAG:793]